MSKDGYKSISIDDETHDMLQKVAAKVKDNTGIEFVSNHQIIKFLATKELAQKK